MSADLVQPAAAGVEDYKTAMRHVVSPVGVVTWRHPRGRAGLTVTAICSATTEPPTLLVCIRNDKPAAAQIRAAGSLCINFLNDQQSGIAQRFSSSGAGGEAAFEPALWNPGTLGDPALSGAVASFDCRVARAFDEGCHSVILARVAHLRQGPGSGLLYRDGFLRRLSPE